jgi:hypothetical protein
MLHLADGCREIFEAPVGARQAKPTSNEIGYGHFEMPKRLGFA